ncbi:MAG: polysaccharide deacetylase family protein [Bacteroidetes bacterium]|nr:polysaccharide deacetylase family protein [Bacteroidota bacterium]
MLRFYRTPTLLKKIFPGLLWDLPVKDRQLFLTFDDGPVPGPTDFVLDQLDRVEAKATFFCIGDNIRKHPETFNKILAAGHRIGNHTYNHISGWSNGASDYVDNIKKCEVLIPSMGKPLFRPPYGRINPFALRALHNHSIVMWDILSYDFDSRINTEAVLKEMIRLIRPGSIVVFHDSFKAEKNLKLLLPGYLDFLVSNHYLLQSIN